jgi:hypothetical protein
MNGTRSQQARAWQAVKRVGLKARKSRWRAGSINNLGDFQIIDPKHNWIIAGEKFDFTADDVSALRRVRGKIALRPRANENRRLLDGTTPTI